jgi:hypothetical protein
MDDDSQAFRLLMDMLAKAEQAIIVYRRIEISLDHDRPMHGEGRRLSSAARPHWTLPTLGHCLGRRWPRSSAGR